MPVAATGGADEGVVGGLSLWLTGTQAKHPSWTRLWEHIALTSA